MLCSYTTLPLSLLIGEIDAGLLGLPELQRPFIWKDTKVRNLLDSMKKGYPIGYFMLWDCSDTGKSKSIGMGEHSYKVPNKLIIDGQQRLTSLFAVLKGKKVINSNYAEKLIVISYSPVSDKFEVGGNSTKNSPEWIYNISDIFSAPNLHGFISAFLKQYKIHKGSPLSDEEETRISQNISAVENLKNYTVAVCNIESRAEEKDVSEIFVRVNSGGMSLTRHNFILTLLSMYWNDGRKLIERFCSDSRQFNKKVSTSFNTITEVSAENLVRVVMAYGFNRARLEYGYKLLRGADFDKKGELDEELRVKRFEILKDKLNDVIDVQSWHDFLEAIADAGYLSRSLILSGNAIFYSYALYLIAKHRFKASPIENKHLISLWFFYATLQSLYSGSFESTVERHLNTIKQLNSLKEYKESFILKEIDEAMTEDYFKITLVGARGLEVSGKGNNAWCTYIASLNILKTKVLFSRGNLLVSDLFKPGSDGKRKSLEKHHLFPKNYLKQKDFTDKDMNQMANYALINWANNSSIKDCAPSEYYADVCKGMSQEDIEAMEDENALPHGWENMEYTEFLRKRRELMAGKIKKAFKILKKNVVEV